MKLRQASLEHENLSLRSTSPLSNVSTYFNSYYNIKFYITYLMGCMIKLTKQFYAYREKDSADIRVNIVVFLGHQRPRKASYLVRFQI